VRQCELAVLIAIIVLGVASVNGHAATILVPSVEPTIQAGMDAASEGDTVLVAPGTYTGEGNRWLRFRGTNMVVMSEAGAEATIVDCQGMNVGFRADSSEDSTAVIRGFTVTNGTIGGIYVHASAVTIEQCVLFNNTGSNGGGIHYGYAPSQGVIRDCVIYGNTSVFRGGGIMCDHGGPPDYVPPIIRDCVIYDNEESTGDAYGGGGIYCHYSDATIIGCTVVANTGEPGRAAIYGYGCYPIVRRTVIAFNISGPGVQDVDADHCIIYGNPGDAPRSDGERENLDVNPLFCDLGSWDLTVCDDSPCLPGDPENPWGEQIGVYGGGCGSCDTPVEESTWGAIKAMYLNP
jgi:hypothetical protein